MHDLADLYQELILDHNRSPRNHRRLEGADRRAQGYNPLCGDRLTLYLSLEGEVIRDVAFEGSGCAISTAAASMMTQACKGRTIGEAKALFERFHRLLAGEPGPADGEALGKLGAFAGVRRFPARVKCATLPWHTLKTALEGGREVISTE